jgi:propionyl-CoA carboxylase beta chain
MRQGERLGEDTTAGKIEGLERLREAAAHPASGQAVERQRERGKTDGWCSLVVS